MDTSALTVFLIYLAVILTGAIGWVINIFKLFGVLAETGYEVTGELVIRGVGVIIPILGAILGYF